MARVVIEGDTALLLLYHSCQSQRQQKFERPTARRGKEEVPASDATRVGGFIDASFSRHITNNGQTARSSRCPTQLNTAQRPGAVDSLLTSFMLLLRSKYFHYVLRQ